MPISSMDQVLRWWPCLSSVELKVRLFQQSRPNIAVGRHRQTLAVFCRSRKARVDEKQPIRLV